MRLSALLCSAAAVAAAPPRVGLYVGGGATGPSFINYTIAFQSLNIPYVTLNSTDVDAGLKGFDVFLMPGGMSTTESIDVGNLGLSNILQFVAEGGGYIGVCAGAYLAMTAECCDKRVTGYCNNQTGCYKTPWSLGMVNAGTTNPWDRGHGYVNISFTDAAVDMLKLPASYRSANKTIMYWCVAGYATANLHSLLRCYRKTALSPHQPRTFQSFSLFGIHSYRQGPILDPSYHSEGYSVLATYKSEIHIDWPSYTTGVMINTPAIVTSTYGQGRVLLSSPHPEESVPIITELIGAYVNWAGKAI